MKPNAIELLQKLGLAVLETISEAGDLGTPGGHLYAAMQTQGASLSQYESFMQGLVNNRMLTKEGDCFYVTDEGKQFMAKLQAKFGHAAQRRASGAICSSSFA